MKVQAIVKVLSAPVKRTNRSGHDYMQQLLVLEAKDGEGTALWALSLNDEMQQSVREQGIQAGSPVEASLVFDTFESGNGFVGNKVNISAITKMVQGAEQAFAVPQAPPMGCASDCGMAGMQGYHPTMMP